MRCDHVYQSKGRFYKRQEWLFGSQMFTVFQCKECTRCNRQERKVELKKRVTASPDRYERQLRFSGIKPANQTN